MPQQSNSGRVVSLVTVVEGDVFVADAGDTTWTAATNNTGDTPPLITSGIIFSAQNGLKLWFADGMNEVYYDPVDNTVNRWEATYGELPADSANNKPRLIETWRGRTVLSGLLLDPQNIHMSRVNDPTDFDYFPSTDRQGPDQAIALTVAPQGLVGDLVTSLCPYNDDLLLIFCDGSIYAMSGDPMAGGQLDLVTKSIGGTWGRCWAMDPYGNVYFMSNTMGVYVFRPGQMPQPISQPIDSMLQGVNTGDYSICMGWEDEFKALMIFITPLDEPGESTHFIFEQRTGAWFTIKFGNSLHSPFVCCKFDGNRPDDRKLLIGSWDGYVRNFSADAEDDDGTPIESQVIIGPFLTGNLDDMLLKEMQAVLGIESGDVTYEVLVGRNAEEAFASAPVQTGTWGAGRNPATLVRRAGHAIYIRLKSTNRWAMEQIRARLETKGRIRGRY